LKAEAIVAVHQRRAERGAAGHQSLFTIRRRAVAGAPRHWRIAYFCGAAAKLRDADPALRPEPINFE
jgi:hypothetical protein